MASSERDKTEKSVWSRVVGALSEPLYPFTSRSSSRKNTPDSPHPSSFEEPEEPEEQEEQDRDSSPLPLDPAKAQDSEPDQGTATTSDVLVASLSDVPTSDDSLGFNTYVNAIADFLTDAATKPPLTLSIEGEWGTGKSSFMKQLEAGIRDRRPIRPNKSITPPGPAFIVRFNAWRHDKDDALWAAFVSEFTRQLTESLSRRRDRWAANLRLAARRFNWRTGSKDLAILCVLALIYVIMTGTLVFAIANGGVRSILDSVTASATRAAGPAGTASPTPAPSPGEKPPTGSGEARPPESEPGKVAGLFFFWLVKLAGAAGYLVLTAFLLVKLKEYVGSPLDIDLKKHILSPDYSSRIAFIEQFHTDFKRVIETYVGKDARVYVFVDDVDRCDIPKAADLMQALNLLISEDEPIVFIIGMDRQKVAAGIAAKYEKVLPYLDPYSPSILSTSQMGIEYGYEFIEKFIQLPFRVPRPKGENVDEFLKRISNMAAAEALPAPATPFLERLRQLFRTKADTSAAATAESSAQERDYKNANDYDRIRPIVDMVAPALDFNPRRLKQFVNLYRLQTYIATATGLFKGSNQNDDSKTEVSPSSGPSTLTPPQLGKFVAIALKWPLFITDLAADKRLIQKLHEYAVNRTYPPESRKYMLGDKPLDDAAPAAGNGSSAAKELGTSVFDRWSAKKKLTDLIEFKAAGDEQDYFLDRLDVDALLQVSPAGTFRSNWFQQQHSAPKGGA